MCIVRVHIICTNFGRFNLQNVYKKECTYIYLTKQTSFYVNVVSWNWLKPNSIIDTKKVGKYNPKSMVFKQEL